MPWRLIGFLVIFVLFIFLAGFNTHTVEVNLGFYNAQVPMFMALFFAFALGAVLTLPFSIISMSRHKQKKESNKKKIVTDNKIKALPENSEALPEESKTENEESVQPDKRKKHKKK